MQGLNEAMPLTSSGHDRLTRDIGVGLQQGPFEFHDLCRSGCPFSLQNQKFPDFGIKSYGSSKVC